MPPQTVRAVVRKPVIDSVNVVRNTVRIGVSKRTEIPPPEAIRVGDDGRGTVVVANVREHIVLRDRCEGTSGGFYPLPCFELDDVCPCALSTVQRRAHGIRLNWRERNFGPSLIIGSNISARGVYPSAPVRIAVSPWGAVLQVKVHVSVVGSDCGCCRIRSSRVVVL